VPVEPFVPPHLDPTAVTARHVSRTPDAREGYHLRRFSRSPRADRFSLRGYARRRRSRAALPNRARRHRGPRPPQRQPLDEGDKFIRKPPPTTIGAAPSRESGQTIGPVAGQPPLRCTQRDTGVGGRPGSARGRSPGTGAGSATAAAPPRAPDRRARPATRGPVRRCWRPSSATRPAAKEHLQRTAKRGRGWSGRCRGDGRSQSPIPRGPAGRGL
jgi:hypothetical protein